MVIEPGKDPHDASRSARAARPPARDYFQRKEQIRLLILCAALMVVLALMNEARKPSTWSWMWAGELTRSTPDEPPIDTRLAEAPAVLPADGFRAASRTTSGSVVEISDDAYLPGITPELLAPIRDNTVMRATENEAWRTMLEILRGMSVEEISAQPVAQVGFAQLFRQTEIYRGRLVKITGSVRRVDPIEPRSSELKTDRLFRWVVAARGGANSPIIVYSLEKPDPFPMDDDLREEVEFTGLCFKRWAYAAGDGTRVAPLLLAKTASWSPAPPPNPVRVPPLPVIVGVLLGLAATSALIALSVYRASVTESRSARRMRPNAGQLIDSINSDNVLPNVQENLARLARSETAHEDRS